MSMKVYNEAETTARLAKELPAWRLEAGTIRRTYKTSGWRATLMIVNTIGHLAEAAWHHPDLAVNYSKVVVKLSTHDAKGITDRDFALAEKIEDVLMWQPAKEGKGLDGTPADAAYIVYE
jgi:4a-hydroxytetrahydrobiopterin dehydratase